MAYCLPSNLAQYLPRPVLDLTTPEQQQQACEDASQEADSYMRGRYQLPLLTWGTDLTKFTSWIACFNLCQLIGYAPQGGADRQITERYYMAVGWPDRAGTGWFPGIQRQAIHPDVTPTVSSVNSATYGLPQVRSQQARGWQQVNSNRKPVVG